MTPKYWIKIVAGMLGIFVVGMMINSGFHKGKAFVVDKVEAQIPLIMSSGFRLDGDQVGDIQRLQFMRSTPGRVDSAVLTIKVDDSADVQRIESCILRATGAVTFSSSTRFACTSHRDSARLNLVPFGHVEGLADGKQVTLFISQNAIEDAHQHAYRGAGSADSGDVDINSADGSFSITVNGREVVRINGDSNGGSLVVRDANGNPIVNISGDSNGGSVQVMDGKGKKVVNIHGTGNGSSKPAHP